jgi:hypothetical protein
VDIAAGVALGVVRLADTLRAVEFAVYDGHFGRNFWRADKGRCAVRQFFDNNAADPFVARGTPSAAVAPLPQSLAQAVPAQP